MPLDNPSTNQPTAIDYLVSGTPWISSSQFTGVARYDFPSVTNSIQVVNAGGSSIKVAFTSGGFVSNNCISLSGSADWEADVRIKTLFLSSSSPADVTVFATLTGVPTRFISDVTGSGAG